MSDCHMLSMNVCDAGPHAETRKRFDIYKSVGYRMFISMSLSLSLSFFLSLSYSLTGLSDEERLHFVRPKKKFVIKKPEKKRHKKSKRSNIKYFLTIYFLTETTQKCTNFVDTLLVLHFWIIFCSSFRFRQFSQWTIEIRNMSKR